MAESSSLFLGIDLGTSSVTAGLFTEHGEALGIAQASYSLQESAGEDGWQGAEQDPEEWWQATCRMIRQAIGRHDSACVAGVCIGGQGPSLVAADAACRPVGPALIWMDKRATPQIERLSLTSGNAGEATVLIAKALWLAEHQPDVYARTRYFLQAWDAIAARLCGVPFTSAPWNEANLRTSRLDATRFPGYIPCGQVVGRLTSEAAVSCGLPIGTPIVAGTNDSIVGLIGCAATRAGRGAALGGTSGGFAVCWPEIAGTWRPPTGTYPEPPGMQFFGAATSASGRLIDWYRHAIVGAPAGTDLSGEGYGWLDEAGSVPPGSDGLILLPYLNGERAPINDPLARGVLMGLTLAHTRRHILRAVLESVAYSVRDVMERTIQQGAHVHDVRVFGGQARSNLWNHIKANVTARPVLVPAVTEAGAIGAAAIAAAGVGRYSSMWDAAEAMVRIVRQIEPDAATTRRYDDLFGVYRELYPRLHDLFPRLAAN